VKMPTLDEAKRDYLRRRCAAHVGFLVEFARLRGGAAAAEACAAWLAPLLPEAEQSADRESG